MPNLHDSAAYCQTCDTIYSRELLEPCTLCGALTCPDCPLTNIYDEYQGDEWVCHECLGKFRRSWGRKAS